MAIKVIRICDDCEREIVQLIEFNPAKSATYSIAFTCGDCVLKELKKLHNKGTE